MATIQQIPGNRTEEGRRLRAAVIEMMHAEGFDPFALSVFPDQHGELHDHPPKAGSNWQVRQAVRRALTEGK